MPDDYELLSSDQLHDLAAMCGRRHWRAEKPAPASSHYVQRSRVENFRAVAGIIRADSNVLGDERTRNAVWAAVCQAVDIELEERGSETERRRAAAALKIAGRTDAEKELVKFINHRAAGGMTSWDAWMSLGGQGG
jgi:hypothetical protein